MPPRSIKGTQEQWERVAGIIRSRRERMSLSVEQLAARCDGKPTGRTISAIEKVERLSFAEVSIRRLSTALGFGEDGLEKMLEGGTPPVPDLGAGAPEWAMEIVELLQQLLDEVRGDAQGR